MEITNEILMITDQICIIDHEVKILKAKKARKVKDLRSQMSMLGTKKHTTGMTFDQVKNKMSALQDKIKSVKKDYKNKIDLLKIRILTKKTLIRNLEVQRSTYGEDIPKEIYDTYIDFYNRSFDKNDFNSLINRLGSLTVVYGHSVILDDLKDKTYSLIDL